MIAIIDYGMGNLRSVEKALQKLGHAAVVTADLGRIGAAERVILPGVGAFGAAIARLREPLPGGATLEQAVLAVAASGRPLLGICLGMQLFLSESSELGDHVGLNLIPGVVERFDAAGDETLKIPHMGWNAIEFPRPTRLLAGVAEGSQVYFVHSYACRPTDERTVAALCTHGQPFAAALEQQNLFATQFHPEKSGAVGLRILDNFARL
jgi:glutamine amidotransferase